MWTTRARVSVASSDADGLKKALEMIGNITAVPEIGKVYLGKVVRLAEFGAFVELFPGTDGLLHISEIAEHRVKEVKDELREGDQVMVKVLAIEGNRIKLSRKALIREQKAKLAQSAPAVEAPEPVDDGGGRHRQRQRHRRVLATNSTNVSRASNQSTILIEGGEDFDDDDEEGEEIDEENEPNFNRVDGSASSGWPGCRWSAPASWSWRPAGGAKDNNRRRRRRRGGRGVDRVAVAAVNSAR